MTATTRRLIAAAALLTLACAPVEEWQAYGSKEGNFVVKLPEKPEAHVRETEVPGLPGKTRFQTLELEQEDIIYAVAYTDLPAGVEANQELLDKVGYANLGGIFALKLAPQKGTAAKFRTYLGTEYHFSVPDHGEVVARVLLVKRRLYVILACAEEIDPTTPEVKRFRDSFELYEAPK